MDKYKNKIAITTGDINGIGTEITVKALNDLMLPKEDVVIITNVQQLELYSKLKTEYEIIDINFNGKIKYGEITKESGDFSFNCLKKACEIRPKAIVTAPVSKEALNIAGHHFNGQTEVLEHFLAHDGQKAEMLFLSEFLNVFLLTRHCALKDVPNNISKETIIEKVMRLAEFWRMRYNKTTPKFALCALNPHAGENGLLGDEELKIIIPAVNELLNEGFDISYPQPADTLFIDGVKNYLNNKPAPFDCYIAMYHDQGLIPIKSVAGDKTVNTTIGLNILRTSPGHGTAFDIAGKNIANPQGMISAIKTMIDLIK